MDIHTAPVNPALNRVWSCRSPAASAPGTGSRSVLVHEVGGGVCLPESWMSRMKGLLRMAARTLRPAAVLAVLCGVLAFATAGLAWRSIKLGRRVTRVVSTGSVVRRQADGPDHLVVTRDLGNHGVAGLPVEHLKRAARLGAVGLGGSESRRTRTHAQRCVSVHGIRDAQVAVDRDVFRKGASARAFDARCSRWSISGCRDRDCPWRGRARRAGRQPRCAAGRWAAGRDRRGTSRYSGTSMSPCGRPERVCRAKIAPARPRRGRRRRRRRTDRSVSAAHA